MERNIIEESFRIVIRSDGTQTVKNVALVREHSLKICVNGEHVSDIICSKDLLKELVVGSLYIGGYIQNKDDICDIIFDESSENVNVILKRTDVDLKIDRKLEKVASVEWKTEWIFNLAESFSKGLPIHSKTQGTHSCLLAKEDRIIFSCEDIGRHNIVDKAVGYALLNDISMKELILYISGRVPADMMRKVIYSGIPVLVSKAVPTADAVELAERYGVALIVKAYPDQIEICKGR